MCVLLFVFLLITFRGLIIITLTKIITASLTLSVVLRLDLPALHMGSQDCDEMFRSMSRL